MADIVATGSLSDLAFVEEIEYGVTPDEPQFTVFRRRSAAGINLTKDAYQSEEIRRDRMVADFRHGTRRAGGDVETEIAVGAYDAFYEALLGGESFTPASVTSLTLTITPKTDARVATLDSAFDLSTSEFNVGDVITTTGFTNTENNTDFVILGWNGTTTDVATLDGSTTTSETSGAAAVSVTAGGRTHNQIGNYYRSYTFERAFTDILRFQTYTGMRANSLAVNLPPTGLATYTWNFVGKNASSLATASSDFNSTAAATQTQTEWGTLTFSGGDTITNDATGDFTADLNVGDVIVFDSITQTSGTDIDNMAGKLYTVTEVTSATVCKVAELLGTGTTATFSATVSGLPIYTESSSNAVMAAANGFLSLSTGTTADANGGDILAVVTDLSFTVDNQMSGSPVVGVDTVPYNLYGTQMQVSGSMTVLFQDETLYNLFEQEQVASLSFQATDPNGTDFMFFNMAHCKFNTGNIGDAVSEGLPVEMEFSALKPSATAGGSSSSEQTALPDTPITIIST